MLPGASFLVSLPGNVEPDISSVLAGGGEMGGRMRALDWSSTPLGPVDRWPRALKTCVRILLTSRQPMWLGWGPELTFLYNDPYRSIAGGKHPAALGQPTAVVWREIWDEIQPRLASTLEGEEGTYDEALLLIMERYGYPEETYYTFSYSPVPDDDGKPAGIFCANTDDTRRIIGERQLASLRDLAAGTAEGRTIEDACRRAARGMESNPHDLPFALIYLIDPDQHHARLAARTRVPANHPLAPDQIALEDAHAAWPIAATIRTNAATVIGLDDAQSASAPCGAWDRPPSAAVAVPLPPLGQAGPTVVLVAGLNPYRRYDDDYARFISLASGQIATAVANAQAYEQERRRAESLAELDRAKTAFFSNVSHEFRTPLTLLLGPLQDTLASPDGISATTRDDLAVAHRNGLRLLRLVNALLDFSRIEAGRVRATFEPTNLADFTADVASTFRSAVERAGLRLVVDRGRTPQSTIAYVDREMWEKVVLNLMSNAFKHCFEGQISVSVAPVMGDGAVAMVELSVSDTGTGIPADELPRLFERFHRVQGAPARTHEGTGIGLALVQELVRLHGGTIEVESELGKGTTFRVCVPAGSGHLPADQVRREDVRSAVGSGAQAFVEEALRWLPQVDPFSPLGDVAVDGEPPPEVIAPGTGRVLLAEDNSDMREYLRRLLARRYTVQAVGDGEAARDAALAAPPDLVLTDVMMPRMDGIGLLRALREDPRTREVPVILLSARAGEEAEVEGLESGADDYLVKPFSARELLARVDARIELARIRREKLLVEERTRQAVEYERERLYTLFMRAPAAICLLRGPEHTIVLANPPYLELVARSADEVLGRPLAEVVPDAAEAYRVLLDEVRQTGEPMIGNELSIVLPGRDGTLREHYVNVACQLLSDSLADDPLIFVHAVDVSELVRARTAAQAAERTARDETALVETLHRVGTTVAGELDLDTVVRTVTDAATVATGAQVGAFDQTFTGSDIIRSDNIRCDPRYGDDRPYAGILSDEPPLRSYLAVPVISRNGTVLGALHFGHQQPGVFTARAERLTVGIAAQAAIAIDNARLYAQVQSAVETRDEFLASAAHDLKTPLASVKGIAQLLKSRARRDGARIDPQRLFDGLGRIETSAGRMSTLIDELLDLGRLQMGQTLELERGRVDLAGLARQALTDLQSNAPRHHMRLITDSEPIVGDWDAVRLRRVVDNLLSNAIKYSPRGGDVLISVHRTTAENGAPAATLSVTDQGVGIPVDDLPFVFDRFRRGSNVGTIQGTGIGLAVAHTIATLHGGSVEVRSRQGEGSTFTLRLPLS